jgi:hypothetical protein
VHPLDVMTSAENITSTQYGRPIEVDPKVALERASHLEEELLALARGTAGNAPKLLVNDPLKSGWLNVMRHGKKREDLWCSLLPCLGLASYDNEPQSEDDEKNLVVQWLFGGRCVLKKATIGQTDAPRRGHGIALDTCIGLETDHPRRHVEVHQLYFATQEEGQEWLHAILKARACQAYTNACLKLKAQPLIPIFSLLLNPSLDTLDLHDVFIGRPATRAIAAFGQLIADDMAAAALAAKSIDNFHPPSSFRTGGLALQHVSLVRMGMGPSDAESVAILLSASCRLRSLILSANAIGDSGVSIVLSALSSNVSLEKLVLDRNYITDAAATRLGHFFEHTTAPLVSIDVSENNIGRQGANLLLNGIYANKQLRTSLADLRLGFNQIGDHSAVVLARLLGEEERICALTNLDLSHAMVGDAGMEWIIWALARNSTLRKLDVRGNLSSSSVLAKLIVVGHSVHVHGQTLDIQIGGSDSGWGAAGDMPLRARAMLSDSTTKMVSLESHISRLVLRRHRSEPIRLAGQHANRAYCSLTLRAAPGGSANRGGHDGSAYALHSFGSRSSDIKSMSWGEWLTQLHTFAGASFGQLHIVSTVTREKTCNVAIEISPPLEHGPEPAQIQQKLVAMAGSSHTGSKYIPLGIHSVSPCEMLSEAHAMSTLGSEFVHNLDGKYHTRVSEDRHVTTAINHGLAPPIFLFQQVKLAGRAPSQQTKLYSRRLAMLMRRNARSFLGTQQAPLSEEYQADEMNKEVDSAASFNALALLSPANNFTKERFESVRDQFMKTNKDEMKVFELSKYASVAIDGTQSAVQAALFKRSRPEIQKALTRMTRRNINVRIVDDSLSAKLEEHMRRILSDIMSIENDAVVMLSTDSVEIVESFLGRCGAVGYEGDAVTSALAKLDTLVQDQSARGTLSESDRWWLQSRQYLTNLMMKRDIETLHAGLANIHRHADHCPSAESLAEISNACVALIEQCIQLEGTLRSAVSKRHLQKIDEALMDAAAFKYVSKLKNYSFLNELHEV